MIELPSLLFCNGSNMPFCSHLLSAHSALKNYLLVSTVWLTIPFLLSFIVLFLPQSLHHSLLCFFFICASLELSFFSFSHSFLFLCPFFFFTAAHPSGFSAFRQCLYSVVQLTPESLLLTGRACRTNFPSLFTYFYEKK